MNSVSVLIDCEKAKYPNTGLHTFCIELAKALNIKTSKQNIKTRYFIKQKNVPDFQGEHRTIKLINKGFFLCKEDVFHATFQAGKYLPLNKNVKVVLTIHDLNFLYEKSLQKQEKYKKKVLRLAKRAHHLVFISEYARQDYIKEFGEIAVPNSVIYNGCSHYNQPAVEKPDNYSPKGDFLFTVGTVLKKKNFHVLPALLANNNMELIIAGNLSDYKNTILDEAKKYGVEERVKIVGPISESDKDWYYRNCTAFVFPSLAEGFGIPVIEALAYGKPTFISKHTSLPEVGGEHAYYFNYDFDPEQMVTEFNEGMLSFKNKNISEQIEYARTFTWENAAEEYCKIYKSLCVQS